MKHNHLKVYSHLLLNSNIYSSGFQTGVSSMTRILLLDPQQQNGFSYARNNPMRFIDPSGLWYIDASASGKITGGGATTGIRIGNKGIDWIVSSGPTVGAEADISLTFSSGNQPDNYQVTSSTNVRFGFFGVAGFSREGTYTFNPERPFDSIWTNGENPTNSYSIGFGAGGAVSKEYGISVPVVNWGSRKNQNQQNKNTSLTAPVNVPANQTRQSSNSSNQLPQSVTQNGVTYVRNSSGLLNVKTK